MAIDKSEFKWDQQAKVADVDKDESGDTFFRVEAVTLNGKQLVTIRAWYRDRHDKEFPTRKAITVPAAVVAALNEATIKASKATFKSKGKSATPAAAPAAPKPSGRKSPDSDVTVTTADDRFAKLEAMMLGLANSVAALTAAAEDSDLGDVEL